MSIGINTNLNALSAQRHIAEASGNLRNRLQRISSALRINSAADDAAGLAISEGLRSQVRGNTQAIRNVQDGVSMIQTAEGGSEQINQNLQRIRELSIRAANGSLNDGDRALIQEEVNQLTEEINRQSDTVNFNERNLLNGDIDQASGGAQIQSGANQGETVNVSVEAQDASSLGVDTVDVSTQAGAEQAIEDSTNAINQVATERAALGAQENRLQGTVDFLQIQRENEIASESRIRDADLAAETTARTQASILTQSATSVLAQANNLSGSSALQLLS